jgi:iron complex outermembrane receptor protein
VIEVDSVTVGDIVLDMRLLIQPVILNNISVTATRRVVEFKNGNTIVNVENSPLAKGNSVYDLLMRLPGVSVYENNIMIQGKTGVVVLVDDRPQRLSGNALINLLKSMNADLVKSIEVLKNPPVKYDASGTSGMINIKTKKVTVTGLTGSVFSSYSQGYNARFMPGGSLNYKSKKRLKHS